VLLIGIWVAFLRQFVYAVHFTQIESWYLPIVAFTIFAWTCYWRAPSRPHLIMMAVAAGLAINTRNQGAFYFAWLCLAPLLVGVLPWRRRAVDAALAITIVAVSLVPWSVRNFVVDGRLSPSAARNAYYLAVLNDPRIGFYGLRYWEGWTDIKAEYDRRYPDRVERDRTMIRDGLTAPIRHPGWFGRAAFWRTSAFYGLLPDSFFAADGPRAPNWPVEWRGYVYSKAAPLVFLPLSLIGLLIRPSRVTAFLAVAVAANVASVVMAGSSEDRVSYPVLPMHMLMALAAMFAPQPHDDHHWSALRSIFSIARPRTFALGAMVVLVFLGVARASFGRTNLYAPLNERNVFISPNLEIDQSLPSLNEHMAVNPPIRPLGPEWEGKTVRVRFTVLNYHCPPKWAGRISYMPDFSTDPGRETYYYGALPMTDAALAMRADDDQPEYVTLGVSWFGAIVNEGLREGDEVEAEGSVLIAADNPVATYWLRLGKAVKVVPRTSDVPAFH
jgi:hypothetical protein